MMIMMMIIIKGQGSLTRAESCKTSLAGGVNNSLGEIGCQPFARQTHVPYEQV